MLDDFSWDNIDPDGDLQDDELIVTNAVVQDVNDVNDVAVVQVPLDLNHHQLLLSLLLTTTIIAINYFYHCYCHTHASST